MYCAASKKVSKRSASMGYLHASTLPFTVSVTVVPLVDWGEQSYTARKLHQRPHYMVDFDGLTKLRKKCAERAIPIAYQDVIVPTSPFAGSEWADLKVALEKREEAKKNFRGNTVQTMGFTTKSMQKKRARGGVPLRTHTTMEPDVEEICIRALPHMTADVEKLGCTPRGSLSQAFASQFGSGNYFEAVAAAITRGPQLKSHVDRENGHREGYDIMAALSFAGTDGDGPYRVAVFGYTRKCIGDHLAGVAIEEARKRRKHVNKRWKSVLRSR